MSQAGPGNLLDFAALRQTNKATFLVGDPQIAGAVLGDRIYWPAGNASYRDEPAIFHVAELAKCGGPDTPATILKQGSCVISVEQPISFVGAGVSLNAAPGLWVALAENRDLSVIPSIQST